MHELGYTKDIVTRVLTAARLSDANAVKAVFLRIGEVRDVVDDLMRQCFSWLARDTIARDAEVVIEKVPLEVRCNACGERYHFDPWCTTGSPSHPCPACAGENFEVVAGMEFSIEKIEVV